MLLKKFLASHSPPPTTCSEALAVSCFTLTQRSLSTVEGDGVQNTVV